MSTLALLLVRFAADVRVELVSVTMGDGDVTAAASMSMPRGVTGF
jgi:hypothetical protein